MGTGPDRHPCVVLAHRYAGMQEGLARGLAAARPDLEVTCVRPEALDAALEQLDPDCDPVVVCTEPTTLMQERAHGWVVEAVDGPEVALLVGVGDSYRVVPHHSFAQLVEAILERVDAPASPPWRRGPVTKLVEPAVDAPT